MDDKKKGDDNTNNDKNSMFDREKLYQPVRELQIVVVQRPEQTLQYGNHDSYHYLYIKMIKVPFDANPS